MMACLLHYNLDVSLLMRYLGGNHTGAHRDVQATAKILLEHDIDAELVRHYVRVMTVGCPRIMNADISRENALQYWRAGNNPSVKANLDKVKKTVNKEDRNKICGTSVQLVVEIHTTHFRDPSALAAKSRQKGQDDLRRVIPNHERLNICEHDDGGRLPNQNAM